MVQNATQQRGIESAVGEPDDNPSCYSDSDQERNGLFGQRKRFPMLNKPGRSAISKCLEEINAAMKNGGIDAARKYRGELVPAASRPSVWGDKQVAAALWNAYDLSGGWVDGVVGVTARDAIDAVEAAIRTLNENTGDPL